MLLTYKKKLIYYALIVVVLIQSFIITNHIVRRFLTDDFQITRDGRAARLVQADPIRIEDFLGPPDRKYILLDLGANTGDSVYNFFDMDSIYPKMLPSYLVSKAAWTVYAFEANPKFDEKLAKMKFDIEKNPAENDQHRHVVHAYNRTAVWTYDGFIDFYLDTDNEKQNFYGSSLRRAHPDVRDGKTRVNVSCVDLVRVLRQFRREDFVVIKMDVEGAEYDLLTHMIVNNALELVDLMAIEYHKSLSYFQTPEQVFNYIVRESGVKLSKWV